MADVKRSLYLRHLRSAPTSHIRQLRRGKVAHDGVGLAFWFSPLSAAISEVPVDDRELSLALHGRTSDLQDVLVQAAITFRVVDPETATQRIDFSIDPDDGQWRGAPLEQLTSLLSELAQAHALAVISGMTLITAITEGAARIGSAIESGLVGDRRLVATGIAIVGVRVVAINPEQDVQRALQTPAREKLQEEADRATFERRALAVDRERAIAENELGNRIELAKREEALVTQEGTNARRRAEEASVALEVETKAQADAQRVLAAGQAEATRVLGIAEGDADRARLTAYDDLDQAMVLALAVRDAAKNLPKIENLTITPDMLTRALSLLTGHGASGKER
jgi:regulator of protease activity HflC (stomatin/prohibitin superfamily)